MQYLMMAKPKLICPHCNQPLSISLFTGFLGSKGGTTTGPTKARTREQAQKAAKARWKKWRAEKAKK